MTRVLIVVDKKKDWAPYSPVENVVTFDEYLASEDPPQSGTRVINLCASSRYPSRGYYCSLLAEARGHHVVPSVLTLNDMGRKGLFSLMLDELDKPTIHWLETQASEESKKADRCTVRIMFGQAAAPELKSIARALFERFPCPIIEVGFVRRDRWVIDTLKPLSPADLATSEEDTFAESLDIFSRGTWRKPRGRKRYRYNLAILSNPEEAMPPSDRTALSRFIKAGRRLGIDVELIGPKDYMRLAEFDALFIRETTAIDHHTYRFARKAEAEGLVVIDDPVSILRCTNKVFLADLLKHNKVPTPGTMILSREDRSAAETAIKTLGLPIVVKIPDGSFSRGVIKATTREELDQALKSLFKQSALVLAQEYFYTEFDWRIGVLGGRALYACKYFMVRNHWQIYQHGANRIASGDFVTMPTYEVPRKVIQAALSATRLIGDGLYGVDIKQSGNRVAVIEINDNPSIEAGVEDRFLGGELYTLIMQEFLSRMELSSRGN